MVSRRRHLCKPQLRGTGTAQYYKRGLSQGLLLIGINEGQEDTRSPAHRLVCCTGPCLCRSQHAAALTCACLPTPGDDNTPRIHMNIEHTCSNICAALHCLSAQADWLPANACLPHLRPTLLPRRRSPTTASRHHPSCIFSSFSSAIPALTRLCIPTHTSRSTPSPLPTSSRALSSRRSQSVCSP